MNEEHERRGDPVTPLFDEVATAHDGDPRGGRVRTWEEIRAAADHRPLSRHELREEAK